MATATISCARTKRRDDAISFHFKLPHVDLALSKVVLLANCLELVFQPKLKVPSLTEQLVAAVMRLVYVDKKRPEFYYIPFPFGHPYYGRQYKYYDPPWMRGTPLGDILAEADWKMKCLHVGARSDDSKQTFEAWSNRSQLTGLAQWMDFPRDPHPTSASIIMSCESAKVHKTDTELTFVEDPKMRIVDHSNTLYSKYITHHYDSVAYHDEPLFLQMKEIVKLIVAVEWMKEKGVKVNKAWMWDRTNIQRPTIPIAVRPTRNELKEMMASLKKKQIDMVARSHSNNTLSCRTSETLEVTDTSAIATLTKSLGDITETRTLIISEDHDLVFKHLNPQMPLGIVPHSPMDPLIPDVKSWRELFAETVPWPHVWQGRGQVSTFTGGVTTRDIPMCQVPAAATPTREEVPIKSSASRGGPTQKVTSKSASKLGVVPTPPSDVTMTSNERRLNDMMAPSREIGYEDCSSQFRCSPSGLLQHQTTSVPASVTGTVTERHQVVSQATITGAVSVPSASPTSSSPPSSTTSEINCSICLKEIKKHYCAGTTLECGHIFHKHCIDPWLRDNDTCPNCRTQVCCKA